MLLAALFTYCILQWYQELGVIVHYGSGICSVVFMQNLGTGKINFVAEQASWNWRAGDNLSCTFRHINRVQATCEPVGGSRQGAECEKVCCPWKINCKTKHSSSQSAPRPNYSHRIPQQTSIQTSTCTLKCNSCFKRVQEAGEQRKEGG
jgi:hypothetical protein